MDPYGGARGAVPTWTGDHGFLDKPTDTTGLVQVGARYYDPGLGKFVSVDPIMDVTDPQQWAPYGYSNSNPVTWADPSGMKYLDGQGGSSGSSSSSAVGSLARSIVSVFFPVVTVAVKIIRVVKQRHVSAPPARRSSVRVPTHVSGKDRAMAARAESARKRSAAAMAWLEANIYPFGSPGAFGVGSWMAWNQVWAGGREKGLKNTLKNYQGRKGSVRANALTELENAGYGKGTNRLSAAKSDLARAAKVGRYMKYGGGALAFAGGAYSQYDASVATESSKGKIVGEMAITGTASTIGAVIG